VAVDDFFAEEHKNHLEVISVVISIFTQRFYKQINLHLLNFRGCFDKTLLNSFSFDEGVLLRVTIGKKVAQFPVFFMLNQVVCKDCESFFYFFTLVCK
jgi:hypothetical protein